MLFKKSFIIDHYLLKNYKLKVYQKNDLETNMIFQNLLNWKFCKYLHFFQNAAPTMLIFSAILKLHIFKTRVSVKKKKKNQHSEIPICFQYRISLIEKSSEVPTKLFKIK